VEGPEATEINLEAKQSSGRLTKEERDGGWQRLTQERNEPSKSEAERDSVLERGDAVEEEAGPTISV